jgi:molybdate transport system substrate-binding protein
MIVLASAAQTVLTVFAAASLHAAFPELGKQFEAAHPGVSVRFDFDGSQILEAQLAQGAQADVFASADQRWMDKATSDGLVGPRAQFATNALVIVAGSSSGVSTPQDLTKPGIKLVLCADAVPCGRYARDTLGKMESEPAFGKGYAAAVTHNIVSEEQNVEDVLAKVNLGEADAGMVYRTDAAGRESVKVIDLPSQDQPSIVYPMASVTKSSSPDLAAAFVAFVRSPQGQAILKKFGFGPAP